MTSKASSSSATARSSSRKSSTSSRRASRKFLIDFSQTGYIDSSGLGVLVSLSKKIREQGGELRLANLNDDLQTLFELTKLDTLFQISDTRERALESCWVGQRSPLDLSIPSDVQYIEGAARARAAALPRAQVSSAEMLAQRSGGAFRGALERDPARQ